MSLPCELVPNIMPSERPGSGAISFGRNGVAGSREWSVPWSAPDGTSYYLDFIQRLLGMTIAGPSGLPQITYPDVFSADFPWLYCQECDVKGEDSLGTDAWGRMQYRKAVITAKYMPYEIGESISLSAQALPIKENSYAWLGRLIPEPPKFQADLANTRIPPQQLLEQAAQFRLAYNNWLSQVSRYFLNPGLDGSEMAGANTIQEVYYDPVPSAAIAAATEITLSLTVPPPGSEALPTGTYSSSPIPGNATADQVREALVAGIQPTEPIDFTVTGGPWPNEIIHVTFGDPLSGQPVPLLSASVVFISGSGPLVIPQNTIQNVLFDPLIPASEADNLFVRFSLVITAGNPAGLPAGTYITIDLPLRSSRATLENALNTYLPDGMTATVSGDEAGPDELYSSVSHIEFGGIAANQDVPALTATLSWLDPPIEQPDVFPTAAEIVFLQHGNTGEDDDPNPPTMTTAMERVGKKGVLGGMVEQQLTKIIPLGEYSLDRHQVLSPNFWEFISLLGCVNCYYFLGFPPWTLLFSGLEGKKTILPNGTRCWDLSFKLHFNPNSWNMLFRPETGQWEVICAQGEGNTDYWSILQPGDTQPTTLRGGQRLRYHPWLYRPADLSRVLLYG